MMARNAIEKGSRDHWTISIPRGSRRPSQDATSRGEPGWRAALCRRTCYDEVLHDPAARDPRGFIVPSDQPDFLTATKFVNILIKAGVVVHRATAPFTVAGKAYPAGSYVVKTRAGVPGPRDGHVRAAGSSERLPVSGRSAPAAVRRDRLQPVVFDGRRLRPHARRLRRTVRGCSRTSSLRRRRDLSRAPAGRQRISSVTKSTTRSSPSTAC